MDIGLRPVQINEKQNIISLVKEYREELLGEKADEYKYLNSYWEDPQRHAYYILLGNKIVGFVLVNDYSVTVDKAMTISEFYIKKLHRGKGIGKKIAFKVFDRFPGTWEIREIEHNKSGHAFWKKIINEYTKGNYKEKFLKNDKWNGPVQVFNNKKL